MCLKSTSLRSLLSGVLAKRPSHLNLLWLRTSETLAAMHLQYIYIKQAGPGGAAHNRHPSCKAIIPCSIDSDLGERILPVAVAG